METTGWLCPHCYEEDNPEAGWICNSSICMKRRGLAPTGIAIYAAKERGFKSVAHLLQVRRLGLGLGWGGVAGYTLGVAMCAPLKHMTCGGSAEC